MALSMFMLLAWARPARADIVIQLAVDQGNEPNVVCWNQLGPCPAAGKKGETIAKSPFDAANDLVTYCGESIPRHAWRSSVCEGAPEPSLSNEPQQEKLTWRCTLNRQVMLPADQVEPHVAFIDLRNVETIRKVELNGAAVRIYTQSTEGVARVLAGDYEAATANIAGSFAILRAVPTCRVVFASVPDSDGDLSFGTDAPAQCLNCSHGKVAKLLLRTVDKKAADKSEQRTNRLEGTLTGRSGERDAVVAEWPGDVPANIAFGFRSVHFSWKGSCLYMPRCDAAGNSDRPVPCPTARIPGAGCGDGVITDAANGVCSYTCTQLGRTTMPFPSTVYFSIGDQDDSWSESLLRSGQGFEGFASRDTRQFEIRWPVVHDSGNLQVRLGELPQVGWDFPDRWIDQLFEKRGKAPARERGSPSFERKISHYDILTPQGNHLHGTWPSDISAGPHPLRITVPGATCNDEVTVQYFGPVQSFAPETIHLDKGYFQLRPPSISFRPAWLGARASGAFVWYPSGASTGQAGGAVEVFLEIRAFDLPLSFSVGVAYEPWSHGYYPSFKTEEAEPKLLLNRYVLLPRVLFSPVEPFSLFAASGPFISRPAFAEDVPLAGTSIGFELQAGVRYAVHRNLAFDLAALALYPDSVRSIIISEAAGSASFSTALVSSWGVTFGVEGSFPL